MYILIEINIVTLISFLDIIVVLVMFNDHVKSTHLNSQEANKYMFQMQNILLVNNQFYLRLKSALLLCCYATVRLDFTFLLAKDFKLNSSWHINAPSQ